MNLEQIKQIVIQRRKLISIIIGVLILVPLFFGFLTLFRKPISQPPKDSRPERKITTIPTEGTIETNEDITVVSVSPSDGQKNISQNSIVSVKFNGSLPQKISLTFIPEVKGTYKQNKLTNSIDFYPSPTFNSSTTYEVALTINNIGFVTPLKSSASKYLWSFTTGEQEGESGFSAEEVKMYEQLQQEAEKAYAERRRKMPFIIYLPHQTSHYSVEISALSDTITVTTFALHPDYHKLYKEEALNWMRANGGKPEELTITYKEKTP